VTITLQQARDAKQELRAKLRAELPIVGVGITRRGADYAVKINLARQPAGVDLPTDWHGVPILFEVVGALKARV
jgi:hypothetical protein